MKILITGARGMLAHDLVRVWRDRHELILTDRDELDIADFDAVRAMVSAQRVEMMVNCAAYNAVDDAETNLEAAFRVNTLGPKNLAIVAADANIPLVHFSTDYVFDGSATEPYIEFDAVHPIGVYARSKAAGEDVVRRHCPTHYILRLSWLIGHGGRNFVETMLRLASEKTTIRVVNDQTGSPTFCADVARVVDQLIATGHYGTYHATGQEPCTWYDFANEIFRQTGLSGVKIVPQSTDEAGRPAPRPRYSYLRNLMLELQYGSDPMPSWKASLARYLSER